MLIILIFGIFSIGKCIAQNNDINKELNFTLKFLVSNDTLVVNKEFNIIVNGPFPKNISGHQGGRKENFRRTNKEGQFKLYITNSGEYEFIIMGKGYVTQKIEKIMDYEILVPIKEGKVKLPSYNKM